MKYNKVLRNHNRALSQIITGNLCDLPTGQKLLPSFHWWGLRHREVRWGAPRHSRGLRWQGSLNPDLLTFSQLSAWYHSLPISVSNYVVFLSAVTSSDWILAFVCLLCIDIPPGILRMLSQFISSSVVLKLNSVLYCIKNKTLVFKFSFYIGYCLFPTWSYKNEC